MREFIVCLEADAVVRLSKRPYDIASERPCLYLSIPIGQVAIFDRIVEVDAGMKIPNGLVILVRLQSDSIDMAIGRATGIADHTLGMMSCVAMSAADVPYVTWAYEATDGVNDREYRHYFYDDKAPRGSRPLNDQHWMTLLENNFNTFIADGNLKDDFKERLQRSFMAFRRGLSDNNDVLSEFLTAWSTMEGLDCVYCKVLPSANVRQFKDGMKDVLRRLGRSDVFTSLEGLRNDIAHGSMTLDQAMRMAQEHIELTRHALVLMILRILKVDDKIIGAVLHQKTYKGQFRSHICFLATIKFDPADIGNLVGQPRLKVWRPCATYEIKEDTLWYNPEFRYELENIDSLMPIETLFWGDPAAPRRINECGVKIYRHGEDS